MEPTKEEFTLDGNVAQVMQTLPPSIRNYLAQGKYTAVAKGLMTKYRLHIDQANVVEREIMLLLMGIDNPDEFVKSLIEDAKLDQQTVNGIVQDVNAQIFVPLRDEMRKGPQKVNIQPQTPRPQQSPANAPKYAPIPKFPHLLQNPPSPKAMEGTVNIIPDKKLLEDHEEPHIDIGVIHHPPLPVPPRASPEATQGTAPFPKPIQPTIPLPKPTIPPPQAKPYSSDPYREPIGEEDGR